MSNPSGLCSIYGDAAFAVVARDSLPAFGVPFYRVQHGVSVGELEAISPLVHCVAVSAKGYGQGGHFSVGDCSHDSLKLV